MEDILAQAEKDKISNIIPLITYLEKDPKELREHFGKAAWKKLTKCSYSKNQMIVQKAGEDEYSKATNYHSTLMRYTGYVPGFDIFFKKTGLPFKSFSNRSNTLQRNEAKKYRDLFVDTQHMLEVLGKPFDHTWSPRRMQEEHDNAIKENRKQRLLAQKDKLNFKFDSRFKLPVIEHNGVVCSPLLDIEAVQKEGDEMRHCVAGYADYCYRGDYAVYSIVDSKGTRSTLGLYVEKSDKQYKFTFSQHYGKQNTHVVDKDAIEAAQKVIEELNRVNKEK